MKKTEGVFIVCKTNSLIEANYQLNLVEQRILLACIAKIDSRKPLPAEITFTAHEYAAIYKTPLNYAYEALKNGTEQLHTRTLEPRREDGTRGSAIHWLRSPVVRHEWEGAVTLQFSKEVKPHLTMLSRCFTEYELEKIAHLQSTHSLRLYELLISWRRKGLMAVTIEDFRLRLGLEGRYQKFKHLKNDVINPAIEELRRKAGLEIEWEVKKRGRTVVSLAFQFHEKALKSSKLLRFPGN
ncbi:MAG: replication initiation protein [Candidatus Thiodiazotropha sp. (ex Gloverina cf. vestifex)]|nr:replication initiation protein [Candidatus Thiodiazotropha sp. (ex Gloverina cf. vestifex)]